MQRAADAAALAGVVWLPGNQGKASHRGPRRGRQERLHERRRWRRRSRRPMTRRTRAGSSVAITGPVGTLFARAVGINSWPAARIGEGRLRPARPDGQSPELLRRRVLRGPGVAHVGRHRAHVVRRAVVGRRVRREPRDRRAVGRPVDADQRHDPGLGELQQQRLRHREHQRREAAAVDLRPAQRRVGDPHAGDGTGADDHGHRGAALGRVRVRDAAATRRSASSCRGTPGRRGPRPSRPATWARTPRRRLRARAAARRRAAGARTPGAGTTSATRTSGCA